MKKCLALLLDLLVFTNRASCLSLAILASSNSARRVKIYEIRRNSLLGRNPGLDSTYSLFEYAMSGQTGMFRAIVLTAASFDQARLTCATMASNDDFVLVRPGSDIQPTGDVTTTSETRPLNRRMFGPFSFIEQIEPFSTRRLFKEAAYFPVAVVKLLRCMYLMPRGG